MIRYANTKRKIIVDYYHLFEIGKINKANLMLLANCSVTTVNDTIRDIIRDRKCVVTTIATDKEQENNLKIIEVLRPKIVKYQSLLLSPASVNNTTIGDLREMTEEEKELYL